MNILLKSSSETFPKIPTFGNQINTLKTKDPSVLSHALVLSLFLSSTPMPSPTSFFPQGSTLEQPPPFPFFPQACYLCFLSLTSKGPFFLPLLLVSRVHAASLAHFYLCDSLHQFLMLRVLGFELFLSLTQEPRSNTLTLLLTVLPKQFSKLQSTLLSMCSK